MGLRKGLIFGLLAGAAAATALVKARKAEAPAGPAATPSVPVLADATSEPALDLKSTLDRVRRHAEEAIEAAQVAQAEKERELRRQFDEIRRKQT